jgi:virginiamycin B lyase
MRSRGSAAASILCLMLAPACAGPRPTPVPSDSPRPSAWWLGALPDGEQKRQFILDCTGCHQFDEANVRHEGAPRTREQWIEDTRRMLAYAGARSGFPVISAHRDPERTAEWLVSALSKERSANEAGGVVTPAADAERFEIREFDLPLPADLPHDVALEAGGAAVVTGMFSHALHRIDPGSTRMDSIPIPVPMANPRAIEIDSAGRWWVLLGNPKKIARFDPERRDWATWDIGLYPHSIAVTPDGKSVWFNGHFTRDPEEIGRLDVESGRVERFSLPAHPALADSGGPVPYELRLAPDGSVWMSELQGNRMLRFDPATKETRVHTMPVSWSGPRRFDIDARGYLWIPAYSGGALWKLDPRTGAFREYRLPVKDALPYVARVSPRDGKVWIGAAAVDAVFAFDPGRERFAAYPLPTRGVTVRHMAFHRATGDLWIAYGASPARHPARVARLSRAG